MKKLYEREYIVASYLVTLGMTILDLLERDFMANLKKLTKSARPGMDI